MKKLENTDKEIAIKMNITENALYVWKHRNKELIEYYRLNKDEFQVEIDAEIELLIDELSTITITEIINKKRKQKIHERLNDLLE